MYIAWEARGPIHDTKRFVRGVMKYTLSVDELRYRQSLPLEVKIAMTRSRIRNFISEYGIDGVYVSFSGGKDSTILLDIVRECDIRIPAVFLDTWMEYPQIREFVNTFDNVDVIKPTMGLKDIISQYGWCFPSKDVAQAIWYARKGSQWAINKLHGLDKDGKPSAYRKQYVKWLPLYESDILISSYCCIKQKEEPIALYERQTGRYPILALMAEESERRKDAYLRTGCNSFDGARPLSKPMGFWTDQDVLRYKQLKNLDIASPYGHVAESGQIPGQMNFTDTCGKLRCTGEQRTGCMFCPVGCHLDGLAKFKRLKRYNQKLYDFCMEELGEKKLLEWIEKNILKS
jgi:3'-phosphoadenosine 5'-phosphosulfate sulfotransferase (PAPS reductase)/FAD synthetase